MENSHWMEASVKKIHFSSKHYLAAELKGQAYRPSKHYGLAFLVVNGLSNFMH